MRLVVVDPKILVRAFSHPHSAPARLLALLAYGRVVVNASGFPLEEVAEMIESADRKDAQIDIASVRAYAERDVEESKKRKALIEEAFEQHVPVSLLLATSPPLRTELAELAQEAQSQGHEHVHPDRVNLLTARHTFKHLTELGPAPLYGTGRRASPRDYLIHTGTEAGATDLVTDDPDLQLVGDASHRNPRTGQTIRPFSLEDFIADLPYVLNFDAINAHAVHRAAVAPMSREPA